MRYQFHDPALEKIANTCKTMAVAVFTACSVLVIVVSCLLVSP
jgi:hypothetical protein